ncbi:MAG: outer membrane efflux protein [Rhodospirillaceae bacterium]|nr:MAG: outer membrane efflux protein [Rhodospirillaceae bacterium]
MIRSTAIVLLLVGLLPGCASFSPDGGMSEVARGVGRETGPGIGKNVVKITSVEQARQVKEQVAALLAAPLSADAAVQVALLGNRDLQAAYNDLGISEATYVQASLPPNPGISLMNIGGTGVANFELRMIGDILSLITLPRRTEIAADQFARARQQAVATTLTLATDTRRAYIRAVAAQQQVGFLDQARSTVDAAVRLNMQLGQAGGGDQLDQAELAAFYAELSARMAQARLTARRERETLIRFMGLWGGDTSFNLPAELPPLPGEPESMAAVEVEAINRRVDLTMARYDVAALAKSLSLTEATQYVSMLQLAGIYNNESPNMLTNSNTAINRGGAQLDFQIPIFDTGEARTRTARETYMRALNRLAAKAVNARSEARIAYETYRGTYDIARFWRDQVLPLRQTVSREVSLRYTNGVLASEGLRVDLFRFFVDARVRIGATASALDARRDYYLAAADLQAALSIGGGGSAGSEPAASTPMR